MNSTLTMFPLSGNILLRERDELPLRRRARVVGRAGVGRLWGGAGGGLGAAGVAGRVDAGRAVGGVGVARRVAGRGERASVAAARRGRARRIAGRRRARGSGVLGGRGVRPTTREGEAEGHEQRGATELRHACDLTGFATRCHARHRATVRPASHVRLVCHAVGHAAHQGSSAAIAAERSTHIPTRTSGPQPPQMTRRVRVTRRARAPPTWLSGLPRHRLPIVPRDRGDDPVDQESHVRKTTIVMSIVRAVSGFADQQPRGDSARTQLLRSRALREIVPVQVQTLCDLLHAFARRPLPGRRQASESKPRRPIPISTARPVGHVHPERCFARGPKQPQRQFGVHLQLAFGSRVYLLNIEQFQEHRVAHDLYSARRATLDHTLSRSSTALIVR
jgi:hypothetical protein